jgi:hypothetical protein
LLLWIEGRIHLCSPILACDDVTGRACAGIVFEAFRCACSEINGWKANAIKGFRGAGGDFGKCAIWTTDVTGAIGLPADKEMVMPGDNVKITVKLINPIAMEEGLRFAMREGGKTVGAGVVAKILA